MIIKSAMSETFDDYASMFRRQFVGSVCRVDIVFDVYRPDSLRRPDGEKDGDKETS